MSVLRRTVPHARSDAHLSDLDLSERLDGRLQAPDALQHVRVCARCQADLAALTAIRAEARQLREQVVQCDDAWPVIAARTVHREEVRRLMRRQLRWPLMVALTVGMLLGVLFANNLKLMAQQAFGLQLELGTRQLDALRRIDPPATQPSGTQPPTGPR